MNRDEIIDAMIFAECPADPHNEMLLKEVVIAAKVKAIKAYMNACKGQEAEKGQKPDAAIMAIAADLRDAIYDDDATALLELSDEIGEYSGPVDIPMHYFKPCPGIVKFVCMTILLELESMHMLGSNGVECFEECESGEWEQLMDSLFDDDDDEDEDEDIECLFDDIY